MALTFPSSKVAHTLGAKLLLTCVRITTYSLALPFPPFQEPGEKNTKPSLNFWNFCWFNFSCHVLRQREWKTISRRWKLRLTIGWRTIFCWISLLIQTFYHSHENVSFEFFAPRRKVCHIVRMFYSTVLPSYSRQTQTATVPGNCLASLARTLCL